MPPESNQAAIAPPPPTTPGGALPLVALAARRMEGSAVCEVDLQLCTCTQPLPALTPVLGSARTHARTHA
jgi:hypothetical protein